MSNNSCLTGQNTLTKDVCDSAIVIFSNSLLTPLEKIKVLAIKVWSILYSDQGTGIETIECLINDVQLLYFNVLIYCPNAVYNLFKVAFKMP